MIYNKKYIFGTELLKPWEFLDDESHKGVFVMLMRFLLDPTLGWGLVARTNHVIRGLKLSTTP